MPELPEVETVRRELAPLFPRSVARLYLSAVAPVETTTRGAVRQSLLDATLQGITRWGKYLLVATDRSGYLVIHLGMSGRLLFYDKAIPSRPKHTHLELSFQDGSLLRFIDARRFGTLSLADHNPLRNPFLARLGPDYLDPTLKTADFIQRCRHHRKLNLKTLLLNQKIAAGMGNIYACEALYHAELDPRRVVGETSDSELERLLASARDRLELGIQYGGTTFRDYLSGLGHRGKMKELLQVYDREGQPTLDGRGLVRRIVQQQRATFFCPELQR